MKEVACADVGRDCDFVARGMTEEDVIVQVAVHSKEDHPEFDLDEEAVHEVRRMIRDL